MGNIAFRSTANPQFLSEIDLYRGDEDYYDGGVNEEGLYHGKGVLYYARDDPRQRERYKGEWKNGLRHGNGVLNWSNGAVYQGVWKEDMLHGMGVFHLPSGLCYEGEFYENKFQGLGVLLWKDGKRYEGSWHANRHHGYGCLTYPPNDQRKRASYKGDWKNGKRHGSGTMKWNNGAKYIGEWCNGKREGTGKHIFPSSQIFVGRWGNGRREGAGCRYFRNGDRFEGNWHRDRKDGVGYYIKAHGRRVPHYHENGKRNESLTPTHVQTLSVLCIEKIAQNENLVKDIDTSLTPELAESIRTYRRNEMNISSGDLSNSFINQMQAFFVKLTPKSLTLHRNDSSVRPTPLINEDAI